MTKGEGRCTNCKEQDLECVVRDSSPQSPDAPVHQSTRKSQGKKTVRIDAQVDYMVEEYRGGDGKYGKSNPRLLVLSSRASRDIELSSLVVVYAL